MNQSKSKNILLVANTSWYLLNFKSSLIKKLVSEDYFVYYFSLDSVFHHDLKRLGCERFNEKIFPSKIRNIWSFIYSKNTRSIQHIYTFTLIGAILGNLLNSLKKEKSRTYVTVTGLGNVYLLPIIGSVVLRLIYLITLKKTDYIFVQNTSDEAFIKKSCRPRTKIIHVGGSGVDTNRFNERQMPNTKKTKLLIATRLIDNKGLKELFSAVLSLHGEYKEIFELHVAGKHDLSGASKKLRRLIHRCSTTGAVKFVGYSDEMPSIIAKYHGVILPSYREGLSKFLLEAASVGRPLLVSDVPGCRELVEHGVNGFVFKPRNTSDLKECILQFLRLEIRTKALMGKASRELVEKKYSENSVIAKYVESLN